MCLLSLNIALIIRCHAKRYPCCKNLLFVLLMLVYEFAGCFNTPQMMMWKRLQSGAVGIMTAVTLLLMPVVRLNAAASDLTFPGMPELFISQFKIGGSGNQFVEIYNNTDAPVNMSEIQLAYANHYDLAKVSSSKLVSLTGELGPGEYFIVNDSALTVCYRALVANASLGFNNTNGMVQLLRFEQEGVRYVSKSLDTIAWSKPKVDTAGVTVLSSDANHVKKRNVPRSPDANEWSDVYFDATCQQMVVGDSSLNQEYETELVYNFLTGELPPVQYTAAQTRGGNVSINRNIGKAAPIINEILPNPASPQTDADDEFIELYNPNDSAFDLSGFKLAFGSTNPRKYTFPESTVLQPKEFRAFTSGETSISLSNTEAQIWLLDPNEKVIGQSDPYVKAKEGQAWALDSGKWVWTATPTPSEMNTISGIGGGGSSKATAAVLGISDTNGTAAGATASPAAGQLNDAAPLHPMVLAVVGVAALGYALYEYRHDMSNRIFQFKRYFRNRRAIRQ